MDPIKNPFSPGAGSPPPELVGRDPLLTQTKILLTRMQQRRAEKSFLLIGLRGVGKTVLLNAMEQLADELKYKTIFIEAHENKILGALLIPKLRQLFYSLERLQEATPDVIRRLDENFFRVRFDRLTPSEKNYLRAMAHLGSVAHRSSDIASVLGTNVSHLSPVR